MNTLAIDPENDYHNKRVNCCYSSELYSIEHDAEKIALIMLKFAMNRPDMLPELVLDQSHTETKTYNIQQQIEEFPDLCQQFMLV